MLRKFTMVLSVAIAIALLPAPASAVEQAPVNFSPGSAGIGDPYFPADGNGGYDVSHYDLNVVYHPSTDLLVGVAIIKAVAKQNLSQFNLDLKGLEVRAVRVNGDGARWRQEGNELVITPRRGLADGRRFTTQIFYDGKPQPNAADPILGNDGFIPTDDGALVVGQPHVASSWYPVNDHPSDKASYDFSITVPAGLEAVSNGILQSHTTRFGWTTWKWRAKEPMASYLTTATIGEFNLHSYRANGISYIDAIDPDLYAPVAVPTTGSHLLISNAANSSYKRLTRTISVPAQGAQLSYDVTRDTETDWDFTFVEAHTVGADDWTTLPDVNGHTSQAVGNICPGWLTLHPFLTHYQTGNVDGTCTPSGTSGTWWAATSASDGPEQWQVDLTPFAGRDVEVSISYASDQVVQTSGLFIDNVQVSTGEGNTSFEPDGDQFDGWTAPGAPAGSPGNDNDWTIGTVDDLPPAVGEIVDASFARQPAIIDFLSQTFGRYPFNAAGGIVDDAEGSGFRAGKSNPTDLFAGVLRRPAVRRERHHARTHPSMVR